jgi:uncharacterized membrane protein
MESLIPVAVHPALVHFAIALTLFGVATDLAAYLTGRKAWHQTARLNLTWGVAGIAVAAMAGWFDHQRLHEATAHTHAGGDLMRIHQYLGWTLLIAFSALLLWRHRLGGSISGAFVLLGLLAGVGMMVQSHIGGQLVYREGIGIHIPHDELETRADPSQGSDEAPAQQPAGHEEHVHTH